jgi:hypothetical protein
MSGRVRPTKCVRTPKARHVNMRCGSALWHSAGPRTDHRDRSGFGLCGSFCGRPSWLSASGRGGRPGRGRPCPRARGLPLGAGLKRLASLSRSRIRSGFSSARFRGQRQPPRPSGSSAGITSRFRGGCAVGPPQGELVWGDLLHHRLLRILHNPGYAGAFAFGRTRTCKTVDGKIRRLMCSQCALTGYPSPCGESARV